MSLAIAACGSAGAPTAAGAPGAQPVVALSPPTAPVPPHLVSPTAAAKTIAAAGPGSLVVGGLSEDWAATVTIAATGYSVEYTSPDATQTLALRTMVANPPLPQPDAIQTHPKFRGDDHSSYELASASHPSGRRYLMWLEKSNSPGITVSYLLTAEGMTDAQFWAAANSIKPVYPAPSAPPAPVPGATAPPLTSADLQSLAAVTFPKVDKYGYYAVCGITGDLSSCPYSPRLKVRLTELRENLARAQNPSLSREITGEVTGSESGIAHVVLGGSDRIDLTVIRSGNGFVVDDETCTGRPNTSIYSSPLVPCAGN